MFGKERYLYTHDVMEGLFLKRLSDLLVQKGRNPVTALDADREAGRLILRAWNRSENNTHYWRKLGYAVEGGTGTMTTLLLLADWAATGGAITSAVKAGVGAVSLLAMFHGLKGAATLPFSMRHKKAIFENARAEMERLCNRIFERRLSRLSATRPRSLIGALGGRPSAGQPPVS